MSDDVPLGWRFAGAHAGFKSNAEALDLALVVSDRPAAAVGMFTTNRVCAAPVQVSKSRLPSKSIRGVVVNSGNANACTGEQGLRDAEAMCRLAAAGINADEKSFLVCSTGVIGRPMGMELVPTATQAAIGKTRENSRRRPCRDSRHSHHRHRFQIESASNRELPGERLRIRQRGGDDRP